MTQLPEIEVTRKDLEKDIVGKRIKDVSVRTAGLVARHRNRPDFVKALVGRKIEALNRRGVHLLFELDDGSVLVVRPGRHAGLSRETATEEGGRHTQVVATFTTGGALHYVDPDRDGELFVVAKDQLSELEELNRGIDPLTDIFTWHAFAGELKRRDQPLKAVLVDPGFIAGLGDVYSDEILWAAGLSGARRSSALSSQEIRRLYRALFEVLYEAVKQGGTGDSEADGDGDPFADGTDTDFLKVYGKSGESCARCRNPISVDRSDPAHPYYHCPNCQT